MLANWIVMNFLVSLNFSVKNDQLIIDAFAWRIIRFIEKYKWVFSNVLMKVCVYLHLFKKL